MTFLALPTSSGPINLFFPSSVPRTWLTIQVFSCSLSIFSSGTAILAVNFSFPLTCTVQVCFSGVNKSYVPSASGKGRSNIEPAYHNFGFSCSSFRNVCLTYRCASMRSATRIIWKVESSPVFLCCCWCDWSQELYQHYSCSSYKRRESFDLDQFLC